VLSVSGVWGRADKEVSMFFFEKKNQKTSTPWRNVPTVTPPRIKSFLLLFFKKQALP
jgi:hypothetical protein